MGLRAPGSPNGAPTAAVAKDQRPPAVGPIDGIAHHRDEAHRDVAGCNSLFQAQLSAMRASTSIGIESTREPIAFFIRSATRSRASSARSAGASAMYSSVHTEHAAGSEARERGVQVDHRQLEAVGGGALHRDVERRVERVLLRAEALASAQRRADGDRLAAAAERADLAVPRRDPGKRREERLLGPARLGLGELDPEAVLRVAAEASRAHPEQEAEVDRLRELALAVGDVRLALAGDRGGPWPDAGRDPRGTRRAATRTARGGRPRAARSASSRPRSTAAPAAGGSTPAVPGAVCSLGTCCRFGIGAREATGVRRERMEPAPDPIPRGCTPVASSRTSR